jgi:exonuclease III
MKLVTWNCAMGYKEKHEMLLTIDADIMVIQECSELSMREMNDSEGWSAWWVGENKNKGLGVLVRAPWTILEKWALRPKWTGRLRIGGPAVVDLFPVWAHKSKSPDIEYIEQVHLLLDLIEQNSLTPFAIVAGDFNSHSRWDKDYKINNHTESVERFHKLGFKSAYHEHWGGPHGSEEKHPTHWHLKKKKKAYHVDYVFLSRQLLPKRKSVVVGGCDQWLSLSDHAPLVVELDLESEVHGNKITPVNPKLSPAPDPDPQSNLPHPQSRPIAGSTLA